MVIARIIIARIIIMRRVIGFIGGISFAIATFTATTFIATIFTAGIITGCITAATAITYIGTIAAIWFGAAFRGVARLSDRYAYARPQASLRAIAEVDIAAM